VAVIPDILAAVPFMLTAEMSDVLICPALLERTSVQVKLLWCAVQELCPITMNAVGLGRLGEEKGEGKVEESARTAATPATATTPKTISLVLKLRASACSA
jgi:hypothetical protein